MARAGRKDRGLLAKKDSTGKTVWHVRLYHEGKERRFGAFATKTQARDFYEKAKQEQKQGRFFPERYRHGGREAAAAVIASYRLTLPTSGKTPSTIAVAVSFRIDVACASASEATARPAHRPYSFVQPLQREGRLPAHLTD